MCCVFLIVGKGRIDLQSLRQCVHLFNRQAFCETHTYNLSFLIDFI